MPLELGYWAPQEQHYPSELLDLAVEAERVGFRRCVTSDHFHPWFHTNASSGSTLVWVSSILERTRSMFVGTGVSAPVYRYHPAILAQAFATLDYLHPGRVALGVATGEAMNEVPLGFEWPSFRERLERLEEAIKIIRLLWTEDFVSFEGRHYRLREANLYVRPRTRVPIYLAASGPRVAELAGRLADGLLTVPMPDGRLTDVVLPAFRRGADAAGRDPEKLNLLLEFKFSYDEDYDRALASIRRWGATEVPGIFGMEVYDPRQLEEMAMSVDPEELLKTWHVVTDLEELIGPIEEYGRLGFREVYMHSSSPDEFRVLREVGRVLLPHFREGSPSQ
jgi:coenzyme F420-dependent glucose-6-phosphate dehydrogenase